MPSTSDGREVMISDNYVVPAVPAETLRRVFGDRTPDTRAEMAALFIKYWLQHNRIAPRLTRDKVLAFMQGRIDSGNIYDLISLLENSGSLRSSST